MNPLQSFLYSIQHDEVFRKKAVFFAISGLIVAVLLSFLIWFNFFYNPTPASQSPTPIESASNLVTLKSFDDSGQLEKFDSKPAGIPSQLLFVPGGASYFIDQDLKLHTNQQTVDNSPTFAARRLFSSRDGVIINEDGKTTVFQNGQFNQVPGNVSWLTPILLPDSIGLRSIPGYIYLVASNDSFTLVQAEDIALSKNVKSLAQIKPGNQFQSAELRVLNQTPYLFFYELPTRQGLVEIWQITGSNQIQKAQTINSVESVQFGPNQMLLTTVSPNPTELSNYDLKLVDFKTNPAGDIKAMDIGGRIGQQGIYGSILASRCAFGLQDNFYCLIKQQKVNWNAVQEPDAIVAYQISTDKLDYPHSGLVFSAADITVANNGNLYIVSQLNNLIYRIK
jgi:hypothetical protein